MRAGMGLWAGTFWGVGWGTVGCEMWAGALWAGAAYWGTALWAVGWGTVRCELWGVGWGTVGTVGCELGLWAGYGALFILCGVQCHTEDSVSDLTNLEPYFTSPIKT